MLKSGRSFSIKDILIKTVGDNWIRPTTYNTLFFDKKVKSNFILSQWKYYNCFIHVIFCFLEGTHKSILNSEVFDANTNQS